MTLCAKSGLMRRSKQQLYSITSSARVSSIGEIFRPSALAVLRLLTSYEFRRGFDRQVCGLGALTLGSVSPTLIFLLSFSMSRLACKYENVSPPNCAGETPMIAARRGFPSREGRITDPASYRP